MISWIQKSFQQHFRVVFVVLLAVTIVSFIITIGASPGLGRSERRVKAQPFFDLNLSAAEDRVRFDQDAQLSVFLQVGSLNVDPGRLQQYAYTRYAALVLASQLHLPAPTEAEISDYIKHVPQFSGANGEFDAKKYSDFRDSLHRNGQEGEIARVLSDNVQVEHVQKLLSGPGYVLPSEIKNQLEDIDTNWTLGVAHIDSASFNPKIAPTDAELTKFFTDNQFRYEIPKQAVLSAALFPARDYVDQVKLTEADVRSFYDANPARFKPTPPPAKPAAAPTPPPAAPDYAAVRPQVEEALRFDRAKRSAGKAAADFVVALFDRKPAENSTEFRDFLAQHHVQLEDLAPFSEGQNPPGLGMNPQISEAAFRLNKDRYFSDALQTEAGSVVLFYRDMLPPRQPQFAEVRAKVAADFAEQEKHRLFNELGQKMRTEIAARVQSGEAFDKAVQAVATANNVKADATVHAPFTLRQQPSDLDYAAFNLLHQLKKGEVSEFVRADNDKGLLVYAQDKKQPDLSATNPEYQNVQARLQQMTAASAGNAVLTDLVQNELAKSSATDTP